MGSFALTVHFKGSSPADVESLVREALATPGDPDEDGPRAAYIAPPHDGWITVFPSAGFFFDLLNTAEEAELPGHLIAFRLHDSDVLNYWYFHDGEDLDFFNSSPDYFGEADEDEMQATGDPEALANLLSPDAQRSWAELIATRMINGETVGDGPEFDFEDDRLIAMMRVLGITGDPSAFEYLDSGDSAGELGDASAMQRIE